MKIKLILFAIIILNFSCNSKSKDNSENNESEKIESVDSNTEIIKDFEKNYVGTINKKTNVIFHLKNLNGEISGFYFYQNKGIDIKLKGKILNNNIILNEFDFFNNKVAEIKLETKGKSIIGQWQNSKTNKIFKIDLQETEKEITDLPKNIEGVYKTLNNEGETETCNLTIKLTKKNGEYYYNLRSETRNLNGKVSFSRNIDNNETYIILEGIEWAEYSGDVTNQDDKNYEEKELELPVGIDGLFTENEIIIQNDGNAMNYYVKLNDCGVKYIHLKK
jgi:hypothetical protein